MEETLQNLIDKLDAIAEAINSQQTFTLDSMPDAIRLARVLEYNQGYEDLRKQCYQVGQDIEFYKNSAYSGGLSELPSDSSIEVILATVYDYAYGEGYRIGYRYGYEDGCASVSNSY